MSDFMSEKKAPSLEGLFRNNRSPIFLGLKKEKTMIKAIETQYAGCRFRSRTEARWAVFFDALGIEWEYEKEGYELLSGRYLPDFWLPEPGMWAEVKGQAFTRHEYIKCADLVKATGNACLLLVGMPGQTVWGIVPGEDGQTDPMDYDLSYWKDEGRFYTCTGLSFPDTQPNCLGDGCPGTRAAKSARFEFGETKRVHPEPTPFVSRIAKAEDGW